MFLSANNRNNGCYSVFTIHALLIQYNKYRCAMKRSRGPLTLRYLSLNSDGRSQSDNCEVLRSARTILPSIRNGHNSVLISFFTIDYRVNSMTDIYLFLGHKFLGHF